MKSLNFSIIGHVSHYLVSYFIKSKLILLVSIFFLLACNKKFDEPPAIPLTTIDSTVNSNIITIKSLKMKHTIGGLEEITDNSVISAIVSGDDESGNLYKEITIQDGSGGITFLLDRYALYIDYPVGRQITVKCKGLYLSDYHDNIELGVLNSSVPANPTIMALPAPYFGTYITKGTIGYAVVPRVVTLSQLKSVAGLSIATIPLMDTLQGTLVQINNVELASASMGLIYADTSAAKKSVGRILTDCNGTTGVEIYTSGFASFAGFNTPKGLGTITAIYTPYRTTVELIVRNTADVQLNGIRCGANVASTLFSETFPGITNKVIISPSGNNNAWQNIAETGGVQFIGNVYLTSTYYASISAYKTTGKIVTSWMITPAISIPSSVTSAILTFSTIDGYDNGATFKVMVSTNYNGSNTPSSSVWTQLSATIPTGDAAAYSKATGSGNVDLSAYIGQTIYLGWRYDGTNTKNTTYEFGNIKVVGN